MVYNLDIRKVWKMLNYTNKFVEFLNGANTVKISSQRDFASMHSLFHKVGLDFFDNLKSGADYYGLLEVARFNNCAIGYSTILVEYQPGKGLSFGYKSYEESEKWYGQKPWSAKEVRDSMK